ncbi:MAG: hypothetical protein JSS60_08270 [Verrucomicrobia bacterium]|nr:hypothetical protein [Verrucomicrobiota bacterium]
MTVDPQTNLDNYIDQWTAANTQYNNDYAYLQQMISQMLVLCQQGGNGTQEAYQIAEMAVMPGAMTVQGDTMGQLAASMNVGSALQQFTTDSQNDMNAGTQMTQAQAQQFVQYIQQVYTDVTNEMALPQNQQWLSSQTATNILQSLNSISTGFGASNPNNLDANYVASYVNGWATNPTGTSVNDPYDGGTLQNPAGANGQPDTGQQCIQNVQSAFTQWNNSLSAQSQSLTAQEQFASNTYNQYMNSCTDVFQSTQQFVQNIVQHEIAN